MSYDIHLKDPVTGEPVANALKVLYQLVALAKMRPDCVWDGD